MEKRSKTIRNAARRGAAESLMEERLQLHMDSRPSDQRRRGTQSDGGVAKGQDDLMDSAQEAPPNEYDHIPV
jgi:hypothetical protein